MTDIAAAIQRLSAEPEASPESAATTPPTKKTPYSDGIARLKAYDDIDNDPGFFSALGNFGRMTAHGTARGVAETFGMPVDAWNAAIRFAATHDAPLADVPSYNPFGEQPPASKQDRAKAAEGLTANVGTSESLKKLAKEKAGLGYTADELGLTGTAAKYGDIFGEYGFGQVLPFVAGGEFLSAAKLAARGFEGVEAAGTVGKRVLKDVFMGAYGPGVGAVVGAEAGGKEHEEAGKAVGGVVGAARLPVFAGAIGGARWGGNWLYNFLGFGPGAKPQVVKAVKSAAQDLPAASANIRQPVPTSPGAQVPVDIKSQDEGLFALRRMVMSKDAELAGNYRDMQHATEEAIKQDAKFARANYADTDSWLNAKYDSMRNLIEQRQLQAVEAAEQNAANAQALALRGTTPDRINSDVFKHGHAAALRHELVKAHEEADAVVQSKWEKVDKAQPVAMDNVYDTISLLEAEHAGRPGQSAARFPKEVIDRFFETKKTETGEIAREPKFNTQTPLGDVIDLHSEVLQAIREQNALDVPNNTLLHYLGKLSSALMEAKKNAPGAVGEAWQEANRATKVFHETFSGGPVGEVMGVTRHGGQNIPTGETIRHFLNAGPGGIDSFNALMRAVGQRGDKKSALTAVEGHLRQDFADIAAGSGTFNLNNARRWLANNSGALLHFDKLRNEVQQAIASESTGAKLAEKASKKSLQDLRDSAVGLYLNGNPGELLNGALRTGRNQYRNTKSLLEMTAADPTGKAQQGLVQQVFDHMIATATVADRTTPKLERLNGLHIKSWVEQHKEVIRALNEKLPGIDKRFERIANTAHYLEGFNVRSEMPSKNNFEALALWARDIPLRILGADFFTKFGLRGGSIQTAAIGSEAMKKLASSLTPDQTSKIFREAMLDPKLFDALMTPVTKANETKQLRILQPYFLAAGIGATQPLLNSGQNQQ